MNVAYNIDCMEYMKTLPDKVFDLAIVDPPYGINAPNMTMGTNLSRQKNGCPGESVAQRSI
jgi:site-specific DNA-methyltransferase (adenine-specific)